MSLMTSSKVRDVLEKVNEKLEIPKPIFDNIQIKFAKNKKLYGRAEVTKRPSHDSVNGFVWNYDCAILLSDPLLSVVEEKQQEQTFVHELCHVADVIFNGFMSNHGSTWSSLMKKAGYEPIILGPPLPQKVPGMVTVRCDCRTFPVTSNRATRMRKGTAYRCQVCRQYLEFV